MKTIITALFLSITLVGCSVASEGNVENAPYKVLESSNEGALELRVYDSLVLVSTPMDGDSRNGAFGKLFKYISGDNIDESKIEMTAPVFMDPDQAPDKVEDVGTKIEMTAPVFMDGGADERMMSFVLPERFTLENAPKPQNPDVKLHEITDYKVAVIRFNGRLSDTNTQKHKKILDQWIEDQGYEANGSYKTAGYNAPFTLPMLRRNEVLIPVKTPKN